MLRAAFYALILLLVIPRPAAAQAGDEVPFITTPDNVTLAMLQLARVGPRDHVIDLGSGDGRIVITAARRFGASGLGVELVGELVARSRASAARAGVGARAEFREQDLFATDLGRASVITMYLLQEVNLQLRPRLLGLKPGTRVVSHDWDMGDWPPDRSVVVPVPDKVVGLEKSSRVHLWVVPAAVQGLWCGRGGQALALTQRYQMVEARLSAGAQSWALHGRLDGAGLRLIGTAPVALNASVDGESMRLTAPVAVASLRSGERLQRTQGDKCPAAAA